MHLSDIERLTKEYAEARRALAEKVRKCEDEILKVKRRHLPAIRRAAELVQEKFSALYAAVEANPQLFKRPRTVIFHGVKVGWQKGKGEIVWDDPDKVVQLIKKHFPDQTETLIRVKETPIKSALAQLSVQDLKKIGVRVVETGDRVIIRSTDTDIDKLVDALLKEAERIEGGEA